MHLEEQLAESFEAWSKARHQLGELRKQLPKAGGQQAQTPESAALYQRINDQEATCKRLFEAVVRIADELSELRQRNELEARVGRISQDPNDR